MIFRVWRQQKLLSRSWGKVYLVNGSLIFVLSLSAISLLKLESISLPTLVNTLFPRFSICIGLIPVLLIQILALTQVHLADIFCLRTKTVLVIQAVYRSLMVILFFAILWIMGDLGIIFFTGGGKIFQSYFLEIMLRWLYLGLAGLIYLLLTQVVYFLTMNKFLAFMGPFFLNCGDFFLSVNHQPTFLYGFIRLSVRDVFWFLLLFLGSAVFLVILLRRIIMKRDF
ncbi:hypothetical protein HU830_06280 [Lactobacillus sp. DCY120]|uniref:Uncharacterized protein n=1 Tax=Bombilactobacillus apium TaxID=2675299 RepID=A0A850R461_9LACO|nr:hypothetical protein [Bombilactobacillus apium]NVY96761.1 hypothetical protein [Bombilactobacillus apium]